jgi:PD-(D/E)XK nuclease superfamily
LTYLQRLIASGRALTPVPAARPTRQTFYLNQSRWKQVMDCPRLYGWQHVEGIEPDKPRIYLEVGTAVHAAQVIAHAKGGTKEAFDEATQVAESMFRKAMASQKIKLPSDQEEVDEALATIKTLLPAYYRHYAAQDQLWKPLGMELKFCVEVGEQTGIFLVGRVDNLVLFHGGVWICDYKTMKKLDMRNFLKYELDIQLTAYIYGVTKQLSLDAAQRGQPPVMVRGAIIDGMVKTQVPQFHRELYTRSLEDLREFEIEFVETANTLRARHERAAHGENWKHVFVKNTEACYRYGTCSFRDLCAKDNDVRRLAFRKRPSDYVDVAAGRAPQPEVTK